MSVAVLNDLVRHKWHANAAYLAAMDPIEAARDDQELLHITSGSKTSFVERIRTQSRE
jgi:hypothetical protein